MAKNRKNQMAPVRFGPALKALLLCLFLGGSGVGYVGQKSQLSVLGAQLKDLETRLDRLRRENAERARRLEAMQTLSELEARIKQMNLGLVAPQPEQIVHLVEWTGDRAAGGGLYAHQQTGSRK